MKKLRRRGTSFCDVAAVEPVPQVDTTINEEHSKHFVLPDLLVDLFVPILFKTLPSDAFDTFESRTLTYQLAISPAARSICPVRLVA